MSPYTVYTVEQFLSDTKQTINTQGLPGGLEEIRVNMEQMLANPRLLDDYMDLDQPTEFNIIGHDPETDVYVIVHGVGVGEGGRSNPHDHGSCSVLYGNYTDQTRMTLWNRTDKGGDEGDAALTVERDFVVSAGQATAFASGDIHSIDVPDGTYFLRVTIGDVRKETTRQFDTEKGIVRLEKPC